MLDLDNKDTIFCIKNEQDFNAYALKLFDLHYRKNTLYNTFVSMFAKDVRPKHWKEIPCLPVSFFKTHDLYLHKRESAAVFTSSGTTGAFTSRHQIDDLGYYHQVCLRGFEEFYGDINAFAFCCLLPSYLERTGSSLIHMCKHFIEVSGAGDFYLNNLDQLKKDIVEYKNSGRQVVLIGVSFALLDLAETNPDRTVFENVIVMETGGMKGRRKEITREELHDELKSSFGIDQVHSEYGMTEMLSQAYSLSNGIFRAPPWVKVSARHVHDPKEIRLPGRPGLLNIYDLANRHSMPFIAVDDIGVVNEDESFEVLGRYDAADTRGCNLMVL